MNPSSNAGSVGRPPARRLLSPHERLSGYCGATGLLLASLRPAVPSPCWHLASHGRVVWGAGHPSAIAASWPSITLRGRPATLGSQAMAGGFCVSAASDTGGKHRTEASTRPLSQALRFTSWPLLAATGTCSDAERGPNLSAVVVSSCWIGLQSARLLQG